MRLWTKVREAELDSMTKLGLNVPFLGKWGEEQGAPRYAVTLAALNGESASKTETQCC